MLKWLVIFVVADIVVVVIFGAYGKLHNNLFRMAAQPNQIEIIHKCYRDDDKILMIERIRFT